MEVYSNPMLDSLFQIFQVEQPIRIRANLQMLDMLFGTIAEIFSCVDHEYFQGYNNEESMVKRAVNTSALPTIASKYFGGFSLLYMILSYPKLFYFLKFFLLYLILSFQPRPRSSW